VAAFLGGKNSRAGHIPVTLEACESEPKNVRWTCSVQAAALVARESGAVGGSYMCCKMQKESAHNLIRYRNEHSIPDS